MAKQQNALQYVAVSLLPTPECNIHIQGVLNTLRQSWHLQLTKQPHVTGFYAPLKPGTTMTQCTALLDTPLPQAIPERVQLAQCYTTTYYTLNMALADPAPMVTLHQYCFA